MEISRRRLLGMGSIVGVGAVIPSIVRSTASAGVVSPGSGLMPGMDAAAVATLTPYTFVTSPPMSKFTQALRGVYPLDPNGIPVAVPDRTVRYLNGRLIADHYSIDIGEYEDLLHPSLPSKTRLWGFHSRQNLGDTATKKVPQRHLGGIIVAQRHVPVQMRAKLFWGTLTFRLTSLESK